MTSTQQRKRDEQGTRQIRGICATDRAPTAQKTGVCPEALGAGVVATLFASPLPEQHVSIILPMAAE